MKKGFTLLEVIIAIFIGNIVVFIVISLLNNSVKAYKEVVIKDREAIYSREALRFIESEVNDLKNKFIKVNNNEVILKKSNGDLNTIKLIKGSNGQSKIVIEYDKSSTSINTVDTILEKIQDFKVKSDENLIYISIYTASGGKWERCFGSNKIEKDMY